MSSFSKKKFLSKNRAKKFGTTRTQAVFEKTSGHCGYCGIDLLPPPKNGVTAHNKYLDRCFTLDHLIPISKGGSNNINNLLGACRKCNNKRGSASLDYLRLKLISERDHWPKFNQEQYEFLLSKGVDMSKLANYTFYFERKEGVK